MSRYSGCGAALAALVANAVGAVTVRDGGGGLAVADEAKKNIGGHWSGESLVVIVAVVVAAVDGPTFADSGEHSHRVSLGEHVDWRGRRWRSVGEEGDRDGWTTACCSGRGTGRWD